MSNEEFEEKMEELELRISKTPSYEDIKKTKERMNLQKKVLLENAKIKNDYDVIARCVSLREADKYLEGLILDDLFHSILYSLDKLISDTCK